jgi:hypothetical protein
VLGRRTGLAGDVRSVLTLASPRSTAGRAAWAGSQAPVPAAHKIQIKLQDRPVFDFALSRKPETEPMRELGCAFDLHLRYPWQSRLYRDRITHRGPSPWCSGRPARQR